METATIQRSVSRLLNCHQVCKGFGGISYETLMNWRRDRKLPVVMLGTGRRPMLGFVPKDIALWARKNGKRFHMNEARRPV